jgi:hypothetical protein
MHRENEKEAFKMRFAILIIMLVLLAGCSENPEQMQARQELDAIDAQTDALKAKVSAIPVLELSDEVKEDVKIWVHFTKMIEVMIPDKKDNAAMFKEMLAFHSAFKSRGAITKEYTGEGLDPQLKQAVDMGPVIDNDLDELAKRGALYDSAVELAKKEVKPVPALTVVRDKKTERMFKEHAKKKAAYEALAASIPTGNSSGFNVKIAEMKKANKVFKDMVHAFSNIDKGPVLMASEELREVFPDAVDEAEAIESCYTAKRDEGKCSEQNLWKEVFAPYFKALRQGYEKFVE